MNIYDLLFILSLLVMIGILGYKLYNILSFFDSSRDKTKIQRNIPLLRNSIILFISGIICYFLSLTVFLYLPERLIFITLFNFMRGMYYVNYLFLIVELVLMFTAYQDNISSQNAATGYSKEKQKAYI